MLLPKLAGSLLLVLGVASAEPVKGLWMKVHTCGTGESYYVRADAIMGFGKPNSREISIFKGCVAIVFMNGGTLAVRGSKDRLLEQINDLLLEKQQ